MDVQVEECDLLLRPAKKKKSSDFDNCIICQVSDEKPVRKAQVSSIQNFQSAMEIRRDDVFDRLSPDLASLTDRQIVWHSSCYETYTSRQNLRYMIDKTDELAKMPESTARRVQRISFDWSKCFFCKNKTHKKDTKLINILTFEACESVKNAAEVKNDEEMLHTIRSVNDLIAAEAKYHKACYSSYTSKSNLKFQGPSAKEVSKHDEAFNDLISLITPKIITGKAYDMNNLLSMFKESLKIKGADCEGYTRQKLKARLKSHFKEGLVFYQPQSTKPELAFSSSVSLYDVINAAYSLPATEPTTGIPHSLSDQNNDAMMVYSVAQIIRGEISQCKGIKLQPLNVDDLSLHNSKALLPRSLYWFLRWVITGEDYKGGSDGFCETGEPCSNLADERKIIMTGQDLLHCASHARVKLPKHVSLAISVRHLTGSKQMITLLNRMGHCCSYEEVELVDTSLANEVLAKSDETGVVIPSNIHPGVFVQMAADNNDINEETIDGKHTTHATTLVVYQRKQFGPIPPRQIHANHSQKRRSLDSARNTLAIQEVNFCGRQAPLTSFLSQIKMEWFQCNNQFLSACTQDLAWMLLRLHSTTMFQETGISVPEQSIPGWSGFHSRFFSETPVSTVIGYCPMINGSANEYSTIFTVMKVSQEMARKLQQDDSVITFDLAIYIKAKQLQLKFPEEFKNTVIRLGGFHIALNYLALLGKKYANSGLEDLLIESGVYAAGTTSVLMLGKSYNRGIRAHKLSMEALFRLLWQAFVRWLGSQSAEVNNHHRQSLLKKIQECQRCYKEKEPIQQSYEAVVNEMDAITSLLTVFKTEAKARSKLFSFWEEYISMVLILLQFIKAERTGNWSLHLSSTAAMIPHFFSMDRLNYARWLPVYLADMQKLEDKHPKVYQEFAAGTHSISRSRQPFAQVWADMALEQSVNLDSKSKGGIVGFSRREDAVERWFLTSHERATITHSLKEMCGLENYERIGSHKETGGARMKRDQEDVERLLSSFNSGLLTNPFVVPEDQDLSEKVSLLNIATGIVLPEDAADRLVDATEIGKQSMEGFIATRINTNQVNFWDPLSKLKINTFSSAGKKQPVKVTANDKISNLTADRELFGRLLVVAKQREINLREVLSYELSTVPVAIAHGDGSLRKTTKSSLMSVLEKNVTALPSPPPSFVPTACVIDAMALVQVMKSANSATFGEMAEQYCVHITRTLSQNSCTRVDLVFDQYRKQSIKEGERHKRGEASSLEVKIHSDCTPIPKQWGKYISNPRNKENLADFLCIALCERLPQSLNPQQEVFLAGGFKDGMKTASCTQGHCVIVPPLRSDHEEADTRLLLHAKHASQTHRRIVIRSPDTDVAVLCIAHFKDLQCQELWFRTGVKDRLRFIPIHLLNSSLGQPLCKALPAFHALTGCDSTSALQGIGKTTAWNVLLKDDQLQQQLSQFGADPIVSNQSLISSEAFICSLYNRGGRFTKADDVRYLLFCQKNKKSEELPPTSESLIHHIKRANFQTHIWNKALVALQNLPSPDGHGWKMEGNNLVPVLMTKEHAPKSIIELTACRCKKSACTRNCSCRLSNLSCTDACLCMIDEECQNPMNDVAICVSDDSSDSECEQ